MSIIYGNTDVLKSQVLFDAGDIDYLVLHLSLPQLRAELHHAKVELAVCRQFGDPDEGYWQDYSEAVRLAIDISRWWRQPKPLPKNHSNTHIDIEDIKRRADIVDIISQHIKLIKSGRNFRGLCPFHDDREPSFTVYPESQSWHCFGCLRSGDVISFIQDYHNLDFKEAINYLGGTLCLPPKNLSRGKSKRVSSKSR